jgi:prevent-host-death family protein
MTTVNIHDAKTHLSRLLARVEAGETVVIARAGTPVAALGPVDAPVDAPVAARRLGFLAGAFRVPRDFDRMGREEIAALFGTAP